MPKPVLQALVLADHVYQDKSTGKKIIAGTFNRVCFSRRKRPAEQPDFEGAGREGPSPPGPSPSPFQATSETTMPAPGPIPPTSPPGERAPPSGARRLTPADVQKAGSPYAFISLTDVHGAVPLHLRYRDLSSETILLGISFQVSAQDPLDTVEAVVPVPPLPTPHAGVFALELMAEGELLGALRISAVEAPAQGG